MNPMDRWLRDNDTLQKFVKEYYQMHIENARKVLSTKMIEDIDDLYERGSMGEKTQVFTVLSAMELLFGVELGK